MEMYVDPFVCGVVSTILVEVGILILLGVIDDFKKK